MNEAIRLRWPPEETDLESRLLQVQNHGPAGTEAETLRHEARTNPAHAGRIYEALAIGCFRTDRLHEARSCLEEWVASCPGDWRAHYWRAEFMLSTGRSELAKDDLERVLEFQPNHTDTKKSLAVVLLQSGSDYRRALRYFESYLQRHPEDVEALAGVARCQRGLGETDAARATLDRVLAKHKEHAGSLLTLALLESDVDRPEQALEWLRQLESLPKENLDEVYVAVNLAANCHRRLGHHSEALAYEDRLTQLKGELNALNKALEKFQAGNNQADLRCDIGAGYLRVGLAAEGQRWLKSVLQEQPQHARAQQLLRAVPRLGRSQ